MPRKSIYNFNASIQWCSFFRKMVTFFERKRHTASEKKKGRCVMYKTLKVDSNLLHLQNVLFDLDNYSFDRDVLKLLNDLKSLVDRKMYLNSSVYGVREKSVILLYEYDNKKNKKRY